MFSSNNNKSKIHITLCTYLRPSPNSQICISTPRCCLKRENVKWYTSELFTIYFSLPVRVIRTYSNYYLYFIHSVQKFPHFDQMMLILCSSTLSYITRILSSKLHWLLLVKWQFRKFLIIIKYIIWHRVISCHIIISLNGVYL